MRRAPPAAPDAEGRTGARRPKRRSARARAEGRAADARRRARAGSRPRQPSGDRVKASPLAGASPPRRASISSALTGSGPNGRIVKADVEGAKPGTAPRRSRPQRPPLPPRLPRRPRRQAARRFRDIPHAVEQALEHAQDDRAPPDRIEADRSRTSI